MSFEQPVKLMREGLGSVAYGSPPGGGSGPGIPFFGADDGLSIDAPAGPVRLGNPAGSLLGAAKLLDNREIPSSGFSIGISGTGFLGIGIAVPLFLIDLGNDQPAQSLVPFLNFAPAGLKTFQIAANNVAAGPGPSGNSNIFIGVGAGNPLITGINNTGIGNDVLAACTNGSANIGIGDGCLLNLTTGFDNIAMGWQGPALVSLTSGHDNVALGSDSMSSCIGGAQNIAIGANTLKFHTAPTNNIAIGYLAMQNNNNVAGNGNIAIGSFVWGGSSFRQPLGSFNVGVGHEIGAIALAGVGDNNTFIGSLINDLNSSGAVGSGNTLIGSEICRNQPILSNITVLGFGIDCRAPNVGVIGRGDQNIIIGQTSVVLADDNGARLQVRGDITTADPLSGVGKWKLGTVVVAAVALDATRYAEIAIGGTVLKVLLGT